MPNDMPSGQDLSRRERQIMDVIYQRGRASAAQVLAALPDPPSYSAVRALLRILEEKGHLRHEEQKGKYVYAPVRARASAAKLALRRVLKTFFEGSAADAVAALLEDRDTRLSSQELERLADKIEQARREGR